MTHRQARSRRQLSREWFFVGDLWASFALVPVEMSYRFRPIIMMGSPLTGRPSQINAAMRAML